MLIASSNKDNLPSMLFISPLPSITNTAITFASLTLGLWIILKAPWRQLLDNQTRITLWIGATIAIGYLWAWIGIPLDKSLHIHPLLMTSLTVIFGFRLALVAGGFAIFASHYLLLNRLFDYPFAHQSVFQNWGINFLAGVVAPAVITWIVLNLIHRLRIQNLFIFTLGGGFIGGMLSLVGSYGFVILFLHWLQAPQTYIVSENFIVALLLLFPEGFCNGAIVSSLAVHAPHLVRSYDEEFYLKK